METEYRGPRNGDEQWIKGTDENTSPDANNNNEGSLETRGPDKSKPFNVLNQDGSLADLPDEDVPGKGATDGSIGIGT